MNTMQRWNPTQEFDRMISRFLGENAQTSDDFKGWAPACDLYESQDEVRILLDLPGVKKEDVDIQLKDPRTLIVRGERKSIDLDPEKNQARRLERAAGHFARAFFLPYEVSSEGINATVRDGVLELVLRKPESMKPRRIEIKAE